ncbi:putative Zn-dependent peptidase [Mucilaginibacter yixingensis]|uniref:Putative Zn-dependent peptidase n=1 Tax=Mucilaginibacter yixingensis TaxID=1295612 RepID=A0A2T5JA70_9SPHI|nr:pitrilysin family protein [Mucilaginibacter yixingensis]PTQ96962.1 putative Zn-dependent peptidase [Mucilaginibacter yixingensis]
MLDRTIAPDFKTVEHISLIKPEHIKLANGCEFFYFNSGDQELLRLEWIFANKRFDAENPLLNMATNTMLTEGTATRTAAQIADEIDFYGAFIQVEYGYDHSTVTLYTLNKHLAKLLPVISDILKGSMVPEKEVDTFRITQKQKLQVGLQKNDVLARRQFNRALYGSTAYGFASELTDYDKIKRDDLLVHFKDVYQSQNCTLVVAGKVDDDALNLITEAFGDSWQGSGAITDISQPALQASAEKFYFIERPDALQSAIRIGQPTISRTHPDFPKMSVLNTVLGGYFGSRLMANIREDKGYTYGIGSGMSSLKHTGAWFIATEVGADVCRNAIAEIEKEVNLLKTELVPDGELSLVRNYMLGSLLGSLENVLSHADKFKNVYFSGLGLDYYDRYTEAVKNIDSQQLMELANKYWDWDNLYKVIVGKY